MTIQDERDSALRQELAGLREDFSDMKGSMSKVAQALTTLAVLEERHQTVAATTNKILSRIEKIEERQINMDKREFSMIELAKKVDTAESRVKLLEDQRNLQTGQINGASGVIKVLWAVLGGVVTAALLHFLLR